MKTNEVCRLYSWFFEEIIEDRKMPEKTDRDFGMLVNMLNKDKELNRHISSHDFSRESKNDFVEGAFRNILSDRVISFLKLLIINNHEDMIGDIYRSLADNKIKQARLN